MPNEREEFYDNEIAPVLLRLMKRCAERGVPFVAVVEWAPNEYGRTTHMPEGAPSASMLLVDAASRAHGNVDSLYLGLARHAHKHGHNSIVLQQMGVPAAPVESPEPEEAEDG